VVRATGRWVTGGAWVPPAGPEMMGSSQNYERIALGGGGVGEFCGAFEVGNVMG